MRFESKNDLRIWLNSQTNDVIICLTVRAALRELPTLWFITLSSKSGDLPQLSLAIFRALALTLYRARFNKSLVDVKEIEEAYSFIYYKDLRFAATRNACLAIRSMLHKDADKIVANALTVSSNLLEVSHDATLIDAGLSASELAARPLWESGPNTWARDTWPKVADALPKDEDWDVWFRWYHDVLDGVLHEETYELTFAGQHNGAVHEIWRGGPAAANSWIKEHLPTPNETLKQTPAPFVFHIDEGQIVASPIDAKPSNGTVASDFYEETKDKLRDLIERMQRAQVDAKLRTNAAQLESRLGAKIEDVRIGLLLSSLRNLEADYRNFSSEEGQKECPANLLSSLDSTVETLRDLVAIYPEARAIAAERLALEIGESNEKWERVVKESGALIVVADESPVVRQDAVEALKEPGGAIEAARSPADKSYQLSLRLLDIANFGRVVIKGISRTAVKTGEELERRVPVAVGKTVEGAILAGGLAATGHILGADGLALAGAVAGIVKTLGGLLKPGNPLEKIGKKYDELEKENRVELPRSRNTASKPEPKKRS